MSSSEDSAFDFSFGLSSFLSINTFSLKTFSSRTISTNWVILVLSVRLKIMMM